MKNNTTKLTSGDIREIIAKTWESDLPDRVIEALRPFNGKNITTRILAALPALPNGATWRLERRYGWTSLATSTYCTPQGYAEKTSLSLILARSEASVPLDLNYVAGNVPFGGNSYGENCCYFSARRERNTHRLTASNDGELCAKTAALLNRYSAAVAEIEACGKELEELAGFGSPLSPVYYELRELADPHNKAAHVKKD